jgi:hypothetical protein
MTIKIKQNKIKNKLKLRGMKRDHIRYNTIPDFDGFAVPTIGALDGLPVGAIVGREGFTVGSTVGAVGLTVGGNDGPDGVIEGGAVEGEDDGGCDAVGIIVGISVGVKLGPVFRQKVREIFVREDYNS